MSEQSYLLKISMYQAEIDDCKQKIYELKKEISEAEESLADARSYSTKFYNALDNKKNKRNELSLENSLKALAGWTNQLDELLSGNKFKKADNDIQTLISNIKAEIRRLSEELDCYEERLETAERNLDDTRSDLKDYRQEKAAQKEAENNTQPPKIEDMINTNSHSVDNVEYLLRMLKK